MVGSAGIHKRIERAVGSNAGKAAVAQHRRLVYNCFLGTIGLPRQVFFETCILDEVRHILFLCKRGKSKEHPTHE